MRPSRGCSRGLPRTGAAPAARRTARARPRACRRSDGSSDPASREPSATATVICAITVAPPRPIRLRSSEEHAAAGARGLDRRIHAGAARSDDQDVGLDMHFGVFGVVAHAGASIVRHYSKLVLGDPPRVATGHRNTLAGSFHMRYSWIVCTATIVQTAPHVPEFNVAGREPASSRRGRITRMTGCRPFCAIGRIDGGSRWP